MAEWDRVHVKSIDVHGSHCPDCKDTRLDLEGAVWKCGQCARSFAGTNVEYHFCLLVRSVATGRVTEFHVPPEDEEKVMRASAESGKQFLVQYDAETGTISAFKIMEQIATW